MRVDQKVLIVLSFSKDSVDNSNMSQNFRAPKRQDYCRQLDPSTRSFQYNGNLPDAIVPTVRGQIAHSSYHLMLTRYWRRSFHLAMSEHMTWRLDLTLCTAWFTPFSSHLKPLHSRCTEWMKMLHREWAGSIWSNECNACWGWQQVIMWARDCGRSRT